MRLPPKRPSWSRASARREGGTARRDDARRPRRGLRCHVRGPGRRRRPRRPPRNGRADQLSGLGGADRLYGQRGADRLAGGRGNDVLVGGPGRDALSAGPGDDRIDARDGQVDTIACGTGRDTIQQDPIDKRASDCPAACTVDVTTGCTPRTTLSFTDETWTCSRPLARYGKLPIKVIATFTNNLTRFGVRLDPGCTGDRDPSTIDLILDVRGDGQTYGTADDAIRITNASPGASNIQITGHADCGKKQSAFHQDGIHAIGGTNITFVDFTIGDWNTGVATCQGAGGAVFYSGATGVAPRNMTVIRGRYISVQPRSSRRPRSGDVTHR